MNILLKMPINPYSFKGKTCQKISIVMINRIKFKKIMNVKKLKNIF